MKYRSPIIKIVSIALACVFLVECTVYYPVQGPPSEMDSNREFMLFKEQLRFRLEEVSIRSDTLYAKVSDNFNERSKQNRMDVILKWGYQPEQDSAGVVIIPFSSIDYIEYYAIDKDKSYRNTVIAVVTILVGGLIFLAIGFAMAMADLSMSFGADEEP
jgi:hypothetical protein